MAMQIDYRESAAAPSGLPRNPSIPAIHRNTATGFFYEWNTHSQSWLAKPKVYRALLTQSDTDAPVATVLEDTLGQSIVWTRNNIGQYIGTLTDQLSEKKLFLIMGSPLNEGSDYRIVYSYEFAAKKVSVITFDDGGSLADELLFNISIEILVYP